MTNPSTPVLEARTVHKTYQRGATELTALHGVSISIQAGEFVAIMGPSGSGKSTLMHLLGALDEPTDGEVLVAGRSVANLRRSERARLRAEEIGFVFQAFNLIPGLSAIDNVTLPAMLTSRRSGIRARAADLLDRVGLTDAAHASPSELSGGQQQRVAVARALIMNPAVVLADEPTGNLDSTTGREVLSLLEGTREANRTLVIVTHDQRVAARADRIITLRDGRIAEQLDTHPAETTKARSRARLFEVGDRPLRAGKPS